MQNFKKTCVLIFCVLTGALLSGCYSTKVKPSGLYSVYGAISNSSNPNYVRVKNLSTPFFPDSIPKLNATVTFEDLEDGTTTTLQDTVIEFSGNYTHNFMIDQFLKPKTKYRFKVTRSDGKSVSSIVTEPGLAQPSVLPSGHVACHQAIHISFKNVIRPEYIQMKIGFFYYGTFFSREIGKVLKLSYKSDTEMTLDGTILDLLMEVFPNPHLGDPRYNQKSLLPTVLCNELDSAKAVISYTHFGPEWAQYPSLFNGDPTKSFDVMDGLGFLGAFRRDTFTFTLDTTSAL